MTTQRACIHGPLLNGLMLGLFMFGLISATHAQDISSDATSETDSQSDLIQVQYVHDGDTLTLDDDTKVRMLNINAPEVARKNRRNEPGAKAAKKWLHNQLEGQFVYLELDQEKTDRYGRTLAHVFTEDDQHINLLLIEKGLATANIHPPNLKYSDAFLSAQQKARQANIGLWRHPDYQPRLITSSLALKTRSWQRLRGTPLRIRHDKRFIRLLFSNNINIRIPNKNAALFKRLNQYLGHEIEVSGFINQRSGHYSLLLRHPSNIRLIKP